MDACWTELTTVRFADISINRIIATAHIPRGSFYQYFEDKEDLIHFLLELYHGKGQHCAGQVKHLVGILPVLPPEPGGVNHFPKLIWQKMFGPAHKALQIHPFIQRHYFYEQC